ncbi:hypothetical protein TH61_12890 [Rufibacter sp. DG15C]|nr:hypothetical protein TH61_12890 [Rufibacter sp. DG15C]
MPTQDSTKVYSKEEVDAQAFFAPKKNSKNDLYNLMRFISKEYRFPGAAIRYGLSGDVLLLFTVDKQGNLTDFKVDKPMYPEIEAELIRVVQLTSGQWKPAMKDDKVVNSMFTLPWKFSVR